MKSFSGVSARFSRMQLPLAQLRVSLAPRALPQPFLAAACSGLRSPARRRAGCQSTGA
jgi:hypothetical protein